VTRDAAPQPQRWTTRAAASGAVQAVALAFGHISRSKVGDLATQTRCVGRQWVCLHVDAPQLSPPRPAYAFRGSQDVEKAVFVVE
jgi:hypothetical protein